MNKAEVQEIYDKVSTPRTISAIEALGLKSCLSDDLFGTFSVENISDTDVYNGDPICIGGTVWFDDEEYLVRAYKPASDNSNERILVTCCDAWETPMWLYLGGNDVTVRNPNAQVVDPRSSLEDAASALRALQDTLQKDVFSKLETALESLTEAQKD